MTKQELNRDIKRLHKRFLDREKISQKLDIDYYVFEDQVKAEFKRLYYADSKAEYINLNNLKRMIRMNLVLRTISLHMFYIGIEDDKI